MNGSQIDVWKRRTNTMVHPKPLSHASRLLLVKKTFVSLELNAHEELIKRNRVAAVTLLNSLASRITRTEIRKRARSCNKKKRK